MDLKTSVYDMRHDQFKRELALRTRPQNIYWYAPEIYTYMSGLFFENCSDSTLREWAFQWASDKLNQDYDLIYNRWLSDIKL